jgi:GxxExxY protein
VEIEELAAIAVDCGFQIHKEFGPGLLESAYEILMYDSLIVRGLKVDRQVPINITFQHRVIRDCFRADLLIEDKLLIELKSVERLAPIHGKQGLLMNFGGATFKEGIKRISNGHNLLAP